MVQRSMLIATQQMEQVQLVRLLDSLVLQQHIPLLPSTKSILVGGTFSNNTNNNINVTVELLDSSVGVTSTGSVAIASKIPVPAGSSFVISDTGKTVLESRDEIRVYCDTNDAVDVSLSVLTGVN